MLKKTILTLVSTLTCVSVLAKNQDDDWQTQQSPCANNTHLLCGGYYLEPDYPSTTENNDKAQDPPIKIAADYSEIEDKGDSSFQGNVTATQGQQTITADQAKLHSHPTTGELEEIHAAGHVKLSQPGLRLSGTALDIDLNKDRKTITDANYRLYKRHARGQASSITTESNTKMTLPNASYTTCAPGSNSWEIKAKKVTFDKQSGRGEAWHSWLTMGSIPVFYWPYINFPIDKKRKTGFLQPSFESSSQHGKGITLPFYWNLAPHYDATITPHFFSKRGLKLDNKFQYLSSQTQGNFHFDFLPYDKQYKRFRLDRLAEPGQVPTNDIRANRLKDIKKRYLLGLQHQQNLNEQLRLTIDYAKASDDNYIYDFGHDFENSPFNNALLQKMQINYQSNLGTLAVGLEQYQTLHAFDGPTVEEAYRKLPEITWYSNPYQITEDTQWSFDSSHTQFSLKEIPFAKSRTTGHRNHLRPTISHHMKEPGWFIISKADIDFTRYSQLRHSASTHYSRTVPIINLDTGLHFERELDINNNTYTQTLQPRAYWLYSANKNQDHLPVFDSHALDFDYYQVFRNNRYSGLDRISEAKQVGLGLESNLYNSIGEEKINFAIGRIYYFQDRTKRLDEIMDNSTRWSPLALLARYHLTPQWLIEANWVRENRHKTRSTSLNLQFKLSPIQVFNAGYQFNRYKTKQIYASTAWALTPKIRTLGKIDYDIDNHRTINTLAGIEYHSCCLAFRTLWGTKFRPNENTDIKRFDHIIKLQVIFKGLASVGNTQTQFIKDAIPGYNPHDNGFD